MPFCRNSFLYCRLPPLWHDSRVAHLVDARPQLLSPFNTSVKSSVERMSDTRKVSMKERLERYVSVNSR